MTIQRLAGAAAGGARAGEPVDGHATAAPVRRGGPVTRLRSRPPPASQPSQAMVAIEALRSNPKCTGAG